MSSGDSGTPDASDAPLQLHIRRIIFEKFNDPDLRFTNDQILEELRKGGIVDASCDSCDVEPEFELVCSSGLARNIAQNFNTIWLKLFDVLEEVRCGMCSRTIHVAASEERKCPNPDCGAALG